MRKILIPVLLLSFISLAPSILPTYATGHKTAELLSTGDGDMIIETGENIVWRIRITFAHTGGSLPWTSVVVYDRLNAELELDGIDAISQGTVSVTTKGKSDKVHLVWDVGTLEPGFGATLTFRVSTDINPAGRQEYTSPGNYTLNSGAVLKYRIRGKRYSVEINNIWIEVLPAS